MLEMKEDNDRYAQCYDELVHQLQTTSATKDAYAQKSDGRDRKIKHYEKQIQELKSDNEALLARSLAELRKHDESHSNNEKLLEKQEKCLQELQNTIEIQEKEKNELKDIINDLQDKLNIQTTMCNKLEKEIRKMKDETKDYRMAKATDMEMKRELDHLIIDNQRLVSMLKMTKEWKGFAEDASAIKNGISYLELTRKGKSKNNSIQLTPKQKNEWKSFKILAKNYPAIINDRVINPDTEMNNWIPRQARNLSFFFHEEAIPDVPIELIDEYLKQLHLIWREREKDIVESVKRRCKDEVDTLRRQLENKKSYNEVIFEQKIGTLQNELKKKRKQLQKNPSYSIASSEIIQTSLLTVDQVVKENKKLLEENEYLKSQLDYAQMMKTGEITLKSDIKYIGNNDLQEVKRHINEIMTILRDFQQRIRTTSKSEYVRLLNEYIYYIILYNSMCNQIEISLEQHQANVMKNAEYSRALKR